MVELLPRVCKALYSILTPIFFKLLEEGIKKEAACFGTIRNYAKILRHPRCWECSWVGRVQGSIANMQEFLDLQPLGRKGRGIWIKGRITRGRDKAIHSFCIWFHLN